MPADADWNRLDAIITATESHVFSTRSPSAFKQLYGPPQRSAKEAVDIVDDELRYTTQSVSAVALTKRVAGK